MNSRNDKPNRLNCWGDSLLNKLPGVTRKRRKRHASKIRRQAERAELTKRATEE